jgi:hypothetical protein
MSLAKRTINKLLVVVGVNSDGAILLCCDNTNLDNHSRDLPCINRALPLSDLHQVNRKPRGSESMSFYLFYKEFPQGIQIADYYYRDLRALQ